MIQFSKLVRAASLGLLLLPVAPADAVQAAPPQPFEASYNARYGDFSAAATRTLNFDDSTGLFSLQSDIRLVMFGSTLTSITERSEFSWRNEQPTPLAYEFVQQGLGERRRSVEFDHDAAEARFTVNGTSGTLPLNGAVFDDLSSYLLLRDQLAAGAKDIYFKVLDRDQIKVYHYVVKGEETITTSLGEFATVRLQRIRDDGSRRHTEIWLAPGQDYLLVKLVQDENGRTISLDIREATLNGAQVKAGVSG